VNLAVEDRIGSGWSRIGTAGTGVSGAGAAVMARLGESRLGLASQSWTGLGLLQGRALAGIGVAAQGLAWIGSLGRAGFGIERICKEGQGGAVEDWQSGSVKERTGQVGNGVAVPDGNGKSETWKRRAWQARNSAW
jgi:hypothetical protein